MLSKRGCLHRALMWKSFSPPLDFWALIWNRLVWSTACKRQEACYERTEEFWCFPILPHDKHYKHKPDILCNQHGAIKGETHQNMSSLLLWLWSYHAQVFKGIPLGCSVICNMFMHRLQWERTSVPFSILKTFFVLASPRISSSRLRGCVILWAGSFYFVKQFPFMKPTLFWFPAL